MNRHRNRLGGARKWVLGGLGIFLLIVIALGAFYGRTLYDFWKAGFFAGEGPKQGWTPDTVKNLHVLYTAMKNAHDSDGEFPKSNQWMDKVVIRLRNETLQKGAENEKLVDPAAGNKPGQFGFAMNDAASEKYIDDIKDKKIPLIFQSTDTSWNAHGDPAKIGRKGGIGVSVTGDIVKL